MDNTIGKEIVDFILGRVCLKSGRRKGKNWRHKELKRNVVARTQRGVAQLAEAKVNGHDVDETGKKEKGQWEQESERVKAAANFGASP